VTQSRLSLASGATTSCRRAKLFLPRPKTWLVEAAAEDRLTRARGRARALEEVVITIAVNASEEGKLYGSIGPREISNALEEAGHEVEKSEVIMSEGPVRFTGEFDIHLQLHADIESHIKLVVEAE
jgi:large subunit ribosomal protein L9